MFKIKEETKAKIKEVWIDSLPFITVLAGGSAALILSYDKYVRSAAADHRSDSEHRQKELTRTADAYVDALERNVFIMKES